VPREIITYLVAVPNEQAQGRGVQEQKVPLTGSEFNARVAAGLLGLGDHHLEIDLGGERREINTTHAFGLIQSRQQGRL